VDRDRVPAVAALDPQDAPARQAHHQEVHPSADKGKQNLFFLLLSSFLQIK